MLEALFESKRSTKRTISLIYDALAISAAFYIAICLRLGTLYLDVSNKELISLGITIAVSLLAFIKLGLYRAILRYMSVQAINSIMIGIGISGAALAASSFLIHSPIPRSVPFIYMFIALFLVGSPRILMRNILMLTHQERHGTREPVIIYGAGYSGHQLVQSLQKTSYKPVAFVDDNPKLKGSLVAGLLVHRPKKMMQLARENSAHKVLLALGSASLSERAEVIRQLEPLALTVQTIPDLTDILTGKARIEDIRDVEIDDLLGRDPVKSDPELLHACITDKVVMVTGAGGSIGSELCRQILQQKPSYLILFELNEYGLYKIEQELQHILKAFQGETELVSLIGSVQNQPRLESIMATFGVQTVYHAAAYKHVPLVEHNIIEGVRNNVFGTWYCAEAAIKTGVESFVLVSTDKAVRPTNIMGASKRVSELVLQSLAQRQNKTRFTMVRFGNVLGSSGSVVPLFREQLEQGGPITVTHPDIIRYFMTIPEASELVIQAGSMGQGGDVFVLDMGEPVKIVDLAKRMVHLSGLEVKDVDHPEGDIEIQFSGLRPGEKLYEELLIGDNVSGTEHSRIMRAEETSLSWQETQEFLDELDNACHDYKCDSVQNLLMSVPTDYTPTIKELHDSVWLSESRSLMKQEDNVIKLERV
ncbi:MAG TPA: polysaccharide biosynthesis protein [Porticoccus sp.]|nr:polysaccharide biosynthesis protein [Porticoccus sp.]